MIEDSPCSCPVAAYCERSKRTMSPHLHHLCQTRDDYRRMLHGSVAPASPALQSTCIYRGSSVGTKQCLPCAAKGASKVVPAFACNCAKTRNSVCIERGEAANATTCETCSHRRTPAVDAILKNTTICVTHWERPKALERLLASLAKFYPELPVIVEDTGGNLSAARNRLAAKCPTDYYLMMEEDMELTAHTRFERWAEVLAENPDVGGVSCAVMEPRNGKRQRILWDSNLRWIDDAVYLAPNPSPWLRTSGGTKWRRCDTALNYGLFRRQLFLDSPWDEKLPVQEHTAWLYRLWQTGKWSLAFAQGVVSEHYRDHYNATYRAGRKRRFWDHLKKEYGVRFVTEKPPELRASNVVVLGVGRSNSSIVTKMIAKQYRLHTGQFNADEYAENRLFHEACVDALKTGKLDPVKARRALRSLPEPFVIKDPRLRTLLPQWMPYLEPFAPKLVYVTKDAAAVKASHDRAGWSGVYKESNAEACEAHYAAWPWLKERFDAWDLNEAVKLWDCRRFEESIERGKAEAR